MSEMKYVCGCCGYEVNRHAIFCPQCLAVGCSASFSRLIDDGDDANQWLTDDNFKPIVKK